MFLACDGEEQTSPSSSNGERRQNKGMLFVERIVVEFLCNERSIKMKKLFVTILLLIALLATVTPVAADARGPVGEKLNLYYGGSMEFPAGAPFYIQHGWVQSSEDSAIGAFDFQLEVDGVLIQEDFKKFSAISGE